MVQIRWSGESCIQAMIHHWNPFILDIRKLSCSNTPGAINNACTSLLDLFWCSHLWNDFCGGDKTLYHLMLSQITSVAFLFTQILSFQILANIFTYICVNLAGVFTHYPTEVAQRQAFLETRRCIEVRLTTQRENQQQVSRMLVLQFKQVYFHSKNVLLVDKKKWSESRHFAR